MRSWRTGCSRSRSTPAATTPIIYFEFRVSADYSLEEEQVRTLGRGITLGLGVRVTKGDATGYAYCEDLAWEKMAHAARTAGQIAVGGGHPPVERRADLAGRRCRASTPSRRRR